MKGGRGGGRLEKAFNAAVFGADWREDVIRIASDVCYPIWLQIRHRSRNKLAHRVLYWADKT